jgi:hypothetical protein
VFAFVAAAVVFCVVQDRVTAAGVQEYVARQRQIAEGTPPGRAGRQLRIEDVMGPAKRRSLEQGALWGGVAGLAAFQCGALYRRVRRG